MLGGSMSTRTSGGSLVPQVLLIDDNLTQLRIREAVLRDAGFSVAAASTAGEALALLRSFVTAPDVIVTDHVMPAASGSVFVRQLRALSPNVPVIVVSGLVEAETEYQGLNVTFLRKPCRPEALIREVRACKTSA
jgi:CheY-like chemotaxis protein